MGQVIRFERSGRSERTELLALGAGFKDSSSHPLKFELAKRGDRVGLLPVADVALMNAERGSHRDLSAEVIDDVCVGHAADYRHAHMCMAIKSRNRKGTIQQMETIAARIRARRKDLGLTQVELAQRVGVHQSTISDIENGSAFEATTLIPLAKALQVSAEWVITGIEDGLGLSAQEARMIQAFRQSQPADMPAAAPKPIKTEFIEARQVSNPKGAVAKKRRAG